MEKIIVSDASLGAAISEIKKMSKFREVKSLPRSTTMKRKEKKKKARVFKNYSTQWIAFLSNIRDYTYFQIIHNVDILTKCKQEFPPTKLPNLLAPSEPTASTLRNVDDERSEFSAYSGTSRSTATFNTFQTQNIGAGGGGGLQSVNPFSYIDYGSDEDSDDSNNSDDSDDSDEDVAGSGNASSNAAGQVSIQTRYIRLKLLCAAAEDLRAQAIEHQKAKPSRYADMTEKWVSSYDLLNKCVAETDGWYAAIQQLQGQDGAFFSSVFSRAQSQQMNNHDIVMVTEIINGLTVLADDTHRAKEIALTFLDRKLRYLQERLQPLLEERNTVRENYGVKRWKSNPAPKKTYAERRKEMEEAVLAISKAISVIEPLSVTGLTRRHTH